MVAAVQARDSGDLKASKQSLEELLKIAPNDEGVQRMLADVNKDIERQAKGEAPVLAGVAKVARRPTTTARLKKSKPRKPPFPKPQRLHPQKSQKLPPPRPERRRPRSSRWTPPWRTPSANSSFKL